MTTTREQIVSEAKSYVETPFKHQGRIPGQALDCVGIPICICRKFGIRYRDRADYPKIPPPALVRQALDSHLLYLGATGWKHGSVVLLYTGRISKDTTMAKVLPRARHIGVITDNGIVHADYDVGKVVEHRLSDDWVKRIARAYDFPGVIDPWPR